MATLDARTTSKSLNYAGDTFLTDSSAGRVVSIPVQTSTQFSESLSSGYRYDEFGSFAYSGARQINGLVYPDLATEIITGFNAFLNGELIYSFSGASVRGTDLQALTDPRGAAVLWLAGNDTITLGSGSDLFAGFSGNDAIDGGGGVDGAAYFGRAGNYTVTRTSSGFTVKDNVGTDGTDTLANVERIVFSDKARAFDVSPDGNAGKALELIGTLGFQYIGNPIALGNVLAYLDRGTSLHDLFQVAIDMGLVRDFAGSDSNADLVKLAYRNVVGDEASPDAVNSIASAYLQGSGGTMSQADFLTAVAGLQRNQEHVNLVGLAQTGAEYI